MKSQLKIVPIDKALTTISLWKKNNYKIVFTNGCFDILHLGHVEYLEKSKALGDKLVVGLNSDTSVQINKGPLRPINNQDARAKVLAALASIDLLIVFDQPTPLNLIKTIQPDILVKGSDYNVKSIGSHVKTVKLTEGYSTSQTIEKILLNSNKSK